MTGTGYPTAITTPPLITATLDGLPLTGIVVAAGGLSFTALTPPHKAGGPYDIIVTTQGGPVTKTGVFTYSNGVTVVPNTAPNTKLAGADVLVMGVGFTSMDFSTANG